MVEVVEYSKNDLVVWVEPSDDGFTPILRAITLIEAIEERRKITPEKFKLTDEQLLDDFLTVHWAEIYTKKELKNVTTT